jgi:hypothetical protein
LDVLCKVLTLLSKTSAYLAFGICTMEEEQRIYTDLDLLWLFIRFKNYDNAVFWGIIRHLINISPHVNFLIIFLYLTLFIKFICDGFFLKHYYYDITQILTDMNILILFIRNSLRSPFSDMRIFFYFVYRYIFNLVYAKYYFV